MTCSRDFDCTINCEKDALEEQIAALTAERDALKATVERLSAPVTDEDYMCMFIALSAFNKVAVRGMEVFNAILAARTNLVSDCK